LDQYTVQGDVQVVSPDPIRVSSEQVITGTVDTDAIYADRLVVKPGAVLTQRLTASSTAPESLTFEVRELVVESGGVIDVSGRGYPARSSYPGQSVANTFTAGGSHLGEGLSSGVQFDTFGSIYFPQENGSSSGDGGHGGGVVRIVASERAQVDGAIRSNGEAACRGGAGGSVWLKTAALAGTGT